MCLLPHLWHVEESLCLSYSFFLCFLPLRFFLFLGWKSLLPLLSLLEPSLLLLSQLLPIVSWLYLYTITSGTSSFENSLSLTMYYFVVSNLSAWSSTFEKILNGLSLMITSLAMFGLNLSMNTSNLPLYKLAMLGAYLANEFSLLKNFLIDMFLHIR